MNDNPDGKDRPHAWSDCMKHCSALVVVVIGLAWYWIGTKSPGHDGALMMGVLVTFIGLAGWLGVMLSAIRR